jgi:hypothetical protein
MRDLRALFAFALIAAPLALAACEEKKGPFERAGEKADKAVERTGEELEKAGEEVKDAAKNPPPNN